MWVALRNKLLKDFYQKRTETSLHKKFLKRNLAHVGMAQCMNGCCYLCRDGNVAMLWSAHHGQSVQVYACYNNGYK